MLEMKTSLSVLKNSELFCFGFIPTKKEMLIPSFGDPWFLWNRVL